MIKFKHYDYTKSKVEKRYGIVVLTHPKTKRVGIYFGKHLFMWWTGRDYA